MAKKELPTLIRDTREKKGKGFVWRASSTVKTMVTRKLDYGDYSVEGYESIVAIERKGSPSELLSNILTKDSARFKRELMVLSGFPYAYIICEFTIQDLFKAVYLIPAAKRHFFTPDRILGCIASLSIQYGVPFYFCGREFKTRAGRYWKTVNPAKDLSKKLLLKACKYYDKG